MEKGHTERKIRMDKIQLHIDSQPFTAKPQKEQAGKLTNRITNAITAVTPEELAQLVGTEGRTMVLATMNGKRTKLNMMQQQALALDFDNKDDDTGLKTEGFFYQTIQETLEDEFIKQHAAFIYKTFSYTPEWEKFRVVFILDKPLTTNEQVEGAYRYLMERYPNADRATKDSSRLFYGGREAIAIQYSNTLAADSLPVAEAAQKAPAARKPVQARAVKPIQTAAQVMQEEPEDAEIPTYKLIRMGEREQVKARLSAMYGDITVPDDMAAITYIKSLPMMELLGIKRSPFRDLFEADEHPSASIWLPENSSAWQYTRQNKVGKNGNKQSFNTLQVIQKLLSTKGKEYPYGLAIDYLIDVTGVNIEVSEELAEMRKQADRFKEILLSESFKSNYKELYEIFGKYKYTGDVNKIIDIFKMNIYDDNGTLRSLTRMSVENIALRLDCSDERARRLLNLLTLTGVTEKLDDTNIPEKLLATIKRTQTHYYLNGEWIERKTARAYRSNVFEMNNLIDSFPSINERCVALTEHSFTQRAGLSREYVQRTFGQDEADRVFPQDKGRTTSKKSDAITLDIHKIAMSSLTEKGYVIVNELKTATQRKWKSKGYTDYKYKQAVGEMIDSYGLKKISLTNELKMSFGITHLSPTARPTILMFA